MKLKKIDGEKVYVSESDPGVMVNYRSKFAFFPACWRVYYVDANGQKVCREFKTFQGAKHFLEGNFRADTGTAQYMI